MWLVAITLNITILDIVPLIIQNNFALFQSSYRFILRVFFLFWKPSLLFTDAEPIYRHWSFKYTCRIMGESHFVLTRESLFSAILDSDLWLSMNSESSSVFSADCTSWCPDCIPGVWNPVSELIFYRPSAYSHIVFVNYLFYKNIQNTYQVPGRSCIGFWAERDK